MTRSCARLPDPQPGRRYGTRVVVGIVGRCKEGALVHWRCDCGAEGETSLVNVSRSRGCHRCRTARKQRDVDGLRAAAANRPEIVAELRAMRERAPEVWLGDDPACREAVRELMAVLPPLSLAEIGHALGVSRERARQIEAAGLRHMTARLALVGIGEAGEQGGAGWTYPEGGP